jgi:hypothetical protein
MDTRTATTQDYSFRRYLPAAAAGVHVQCRGDTRPRLTLPRADAEASAARTVHSGLLRGFDDGRDLRASGRGCVAVAAADLVPYVLRITAPRLRCVTAELLSPSEKLRLKELVGTLLSCGLTFVKSREVGGWSSSGGSLDADSCNYELGKGLFRCCCSCCVAQCLIVLTVV